MPNTSFELTVLGCSGGPISGKTCSFLLKPSYVSIESILEKEIDCLLALDAGTGLTSIVDILQHAAPNGGNHQKQVNYLLGLYPNDIETANIENFIKNIKIVHPFKTLSSNSKAGLSSMTALQLADCILNSISAYLITHSHLDHVCSLAINSPGFKTPKDVYASTSCINSIKSSLFNDEIWPDLVSMGMVNLHEILPNYKINDYYSIESFPLSHGTINDGQRYYSTAFLIKDRLKKDKLLWFGDVEADIISNGNFNEDIWKKVTPFIIDKTLGTIMIECSTVDKAPPYYGHMTPTTLFSEFIKLRKFCVDEKTGLKNNLNADDTFYKNFKIQPLKDLNIIIIHVKESMENNNPRITILEQLNRLNSEFNVGLNFVMALPGLSLIL
ncbi:3',5'-cyclic-nucleotide phosphodiesterase [Martiniozyma asiatica (nom. inval.)]|nr:3',5'-cyclic-nucleotide phosphodiesterase [Martiniozyma asiatica]